MKILARGCLLFVLFLIAVSQGILNATGLSPRAFKNVNQCFKPGYEYYSPIFGSAALSCGIIENLRFYNVEATTYDKDGKREYIKDKTLNDDPIMQIIKILFPSPAGQLTTETTADTSFGKFCTKPEQIAALLNFSYAVRIYYQNKKAAPLSQDISKLLKTISQTDVIASNFSDDPFKKTEKNKLLTSIAKAIENEHKAVKAGAATTFYPEYFVEQVITAFFCHKFADQQKIKDLLNALNDNIVDKSKIDQINGLLDKEDINQALGNIDKPATLDDLWIIINRDVFARIIPYKSGLTPISNGSAQKYQRSTDQLTNAMFADCVEVTLRHIINFMVYDPATTTFNMTSLDAHMNGKDATYIKNLKDFYAAQPPDKANAGDVVVRSAWNKVVADLGRGVVYRQKFDAADAEPTNELDSGILNLVRVFKTIFALELDNEPTLVAGQETVFQENVQKLVTDCLQKLCTVLHSDYSCDVNLSKVTIDTSRNDLLGNIEIQVSDKNEQLFSFTICVSNMHIDIQNLNISQKDSVFLNDDQIQKISGIPMSGHEKTTRPSLLLLDDIFLKDISAISCLYQLLNGPVNDTTSIIQTLKKLQNLPILQDRTVLILKNLLHLFPWEDVASVREIMPILRELKKIADFQKTLKKEVKGAEVETENDLAHFSDIFYFDLDGKWPIENLDLSMFSQLREITINYLFDDKSVLRSITMPLKKEHLETVLLWNTKIKELDLSGAQNIKNISLSDNKDLAAIKLPTQMNHLEIIYISQSKIKELDLSGAQNLEKMTLSENKDLTLINFSGTMPNLKNLQISDCFNMKKISGFKFCPQLKKEDFPGIVILDEPEVFEYPFDSLKKSLEALKSKLASLASSLAGLSAKK